MEGITRRGFNAFGFGSVHCKPRRFTIAADRQPRPTGGPLSERNTNDGFVGGSPRDIIKCELYIQWNGDGCDKSTRAKGNKVAEIYGFRFLVDDS